MDNVAKKQNTGKPVRKNQPIKRKVTQMQSGNYSRPFASTFSQSQVNSLILQKANKETSRSYTRYTKAKLQQYIQNPQSNINNIRAVSEWLYRVSMPYRKLIEYYSSMLLYNYQLVPKEDLSNGGQADFITSYTEAVKGVQRINFKADMPGVIATALRDGAYFGFIYDNGDDECGGGRIRRECGNKGLWRRCVYCGNGDGGKPCLLPLGVRLRWENPNHGAGKREKGVCRNGEKRFWKYVRPVRRVK